MQDPDHLKKLFHSTKSPHLVYLTARSTGHSVGASFEFLINICGLTSREAKRVFIECHGYTSVSEYQASLVPAIQHFDRLMELEGQGNDFTVPTQRLTTKDREEKDDEKPQPTQSPNPLPPQSK